MATNINYFFFCAAFYNVFIQVPNYFYENDFGFLFILEILTILMAVRYKIVVILTQWQDEGWPKAIVETRLEHRLRVT